MATAVVATAVDIEAVMTFADATSASNKCMPESILLSVAIRLRLIDGDSDRGARRVMVTYLMSIDEREMVVIVVLMVLVVVRLVLTGATRRVECEDNRAATKM